MSEKISNAIRNFFESRQSSAVGWLSMIDVILFTMVALCAIFPVLFVPVLLLVDLILAGMLLMLYSGFVSIMDESTPMRSRSKIRLIIGLILAIVFAVSAPIRSLQYSMHSAALVGVWFMAVIITILLSMVLLCRKDSEGFYTALEKGPISALSGKKEVKPGDIVLCDIKEEVEAKAKDPREILPAKDRFLHMLVLGPTGCGKTSQIILPMVRQDIQNPEWGITVLEPKGDLAIKAFKMAEHYGREAIYFDPSYKNCPKFNPLSGREVDVVENIATTFKMLDPDSPQFFKDLNEQLTRNAVKVLKRLDKDEGVDGKYATLINLSRLLQNSAGYGREVVNKFSRINSQTESEASENKDIASWFLNDYFPERSKIYENTSGVRSQVSKLIANEYLREVLNPDFGKGEKNDVNFDRHLMKGSVICISTAQGTLRDLSKYLGYFIILTLQSAVFRRPGTEDTRRPHSLYIDEFQTYSTPGFADMLTQGRSYRVSSILATQARAQMAMGGGRDGKNFVELVSSNARNIILFPGLNKDDAKYYSDQFGEYEKTEVMTGISYKKFNVLTGGFDKLGHPTEQVRETKKMTANFSITDLIYGRSVGSSFGEIVYCIIKKNSIQPAQVGKISYIPKDLNDKLDKEILAYSEEFARESAADFALHEDGEGGVPKTSGSEDDFQFHDDPASSDGLDDLGVDSVDSFAPPPEPELSASADSIFDKPAAHEMPQDTGAQIDWDSDDEDDSADNSGPDANSLFDGII